MLRLLLLLLVGTAIAQESGDYAPEKDDQLIKAANEEVDRFESLDEANGEEEDDEKDVSLCQENEHIEPDFTEKAENAPNHNKRYHFFSAAKNYFDAEHACRWRKGSLSSIHNCEENNSMRSFLWAQIRNGLFAWIGVWKENINVPYHNIDGTRLNYTNWGHGRYKNNGRWCTAMNISTGLWFSLRCGTLLPFVCTY